MPRPKKVIIPQAIYHVMSASDSAEPLFPTETCIRLFQKVLARLPERFEIEVLASSITTGGYQLLLKTKDANLTQGMKFLAAVYGQTQNFKSRYRSVLIDGDEYLQRVRDYIHGTKCREEVYTTVKLPTILGGDRFIRRLQLQNLNR